MLLNAPYEHNTTTYLLSAPSPRALGIYLFLAPDPFDHRSNPKDADNAHGR
jgi:hypothetical protein